LADNKGYEYIADAVYSELADHALEQLVEQKYFVQSEEEIN